ncbi:hypothetical protein AB832_07665 [Flavobacteriaceae bacterium (ex Bugula neritina AB1)]|nr:hypothetical protein AB832_07665 [Flavobacteriaceae bacterium (ex Bugula neritina AB1)]
MTNEDKKIETTEATVEQKDTFSFDKDTPLTEDEQKDLIKSFNEYGYSESGVKLAVERAEAKKLSELKRLEEAEAYDKKCLETFGKDYKKIMQENEKLLNGVDIYNPLELHKALKDLRENSVSKTKTENEAVSNYTYNNEPVHKIFNVSSNRNTPTKYDRKDIIQRLGKGEMVSDEELLGC